jgi:hypothetical protein
VKLTAPFPVSDAPITQDGILAWINGEAQKLFRQLRAFANMLSFDYATVSSAGGGAATTLWASPAMPTNGTWTILQIVAGAATSGTAQNAGYGRVATFKSVSGTVAQVGSTTDLWSHESTGALTSAFSVDTTARNVSVTVTDDGTSPMRWTGVMITCEGLRT